MPPLHLPSFTARPHRSQARWYAKPVGPGCETLATDMIDEILRVVSRIEARLDDIQELSNGLPCSNNGKPGSRADWLYWQPGSLICAGVSMTINSPRP